MSESLSLPVDAVVDTMLYAFDRAKNLYYHGQPGPYRVGHRYTFAEFERFSTLVESKWRLSFSDDDGTIFLWGDPSFPHEGMSAYLIHHLLRALEEHLQTAPESDIRSIDERRRLPADVLGSPRIHLLRDANGEEQVEHPGGTHNGGIEKEPDMYAVLLGFLASRGIDIPILAFEGAVHNENIQTLLWEILRHQEAGRAAGSPHFVALGVKAFVSSSCFQ
jgi:hypothetical protein